VFRQTLTLDEVMASAPVFDPLTRFQCCPPTCGAAAAVVCSAEFAQRHDLDRTRRDRRPGHDHRSAQHLRDRGRRHDMRRVVGYDMTAAAAQQVYAGRRHRPGGRGRGGAARLLHRQRADHLRGLGLTARRHGRALHRRRRQHLRRQGGHQPVGGLLSKGHPLGATGLAQCYELVQQLRGQAEQRQVEGARLGLQHNLGLGGACVVTLYQAQTQAQKAAA
jgi:acetyl-CoA acetyltransferase